MYDIIIIGAGVVGCALARKLSRYNGKIAVLEAAEDVADGGSKANSGIVHAGFDAKPGPKKAYYNVKGANMYAQLAKELGVPYNPIGALVLGFSEDDRATLNTLLEQGKKAWNSCASSTGTRRCGWSQTSILTWSALCWRRPAPWSVPMK